MYGLTHRRGWARTIPAMDATDKRRKRKIQFDGREVPVYEPTDGQIAVVGMCLADGGARGKDLKRLFQVMAALCVNDADWQHIEDGLTEGRLHVPDIQRLVAQLLDHEWGALPKKGARAPRAAAARQAPAHTEPALGDDDDAEYEG